MASKADPARVLVDVSLVELLVHRGVPRPRARSLAYDAVHAESPARDEIAEILPSTVRVAVKDGRLRFDALLTPDTQWDGRTLRLKGVQMSETLIQALPGRPLGQAVDHPALPVGRAIVKAWCDDDGTTIVTAADEREAPYVDSLLGAAAGPIRRLLARRRQNVALGFRNKNVMIEAAMGAVVAMVLVSTTCAVIGCIVDTGTARIDHTPTVNAVVDALVVLAVAAPFLGAAISAWAFLGMTPAYMKNDRRKTLDLRRRTSILNALNPEKTPVTM